MAAPRWVLLLAFLLLPLLATARPSASATPAPARTTVSSARQGLARLPLQAPCRRLAASHRTGSSARGLGVVEDPHVPGLTLAPGLRLRSRVAGDRCASRPPFAWIGRGAGDLPPPPQPAN